MTNVTYLPVRSRPEGVPWVPCEDAACPHADLGVHEHPGGLMHQRIPAEGTE